MASGSSAGAAAAAGARAIGASRYRPLSIGAVGVAVLPFALRALGLTLDTAPVVLILIVAATGLNVLVGYTGLVSFGHSAWFGIAGYAVGLAQKHWFPDQILAPFLFSLLCTAALAALVGF